VTPVEGPDRDDATLRAAIVATARGMNARGINRGTSGNVSARTHAGFLITPTAIDYDSLEPQDIVAMRADGTPLHASRAPSSEWRFHRDIYAARPDVQAVVHTHGAFTGALACLERGIPGFHYLVALAGGPDIRCAPYATYGTQALSDHAIAALAGRDACLLAHHGMIAVADSLGAALTLASDVETLAEIYWRAIQVAEPRILDAQEMERVRQALAQRRHEGASPPVPP